MNIKNGELSVSIIGKGIAGLTLACALEQAGYNNIKIYEQAASLGQSARGTGLILACNAMQILKRLGLEKEIGNRGNIVKKMNITNEHLKPISYTDLNQFSKIYGVNTIAIHREDLYNIIDSNIKSETLLGKKLENINFGYKKSEMYFEDSTNIFSNIIIGADGIHSKVRNCCFSKTKMRNAGQICWRGISNIRIPLYEDELNEIWGKGKRFGFVRINNNQIYWYALINSKDFKHASLSELNYIYNDFHPIISDIINNTDEDKIVSRTITDFETHNEWHTDNICLIGDAAHAMTPNLGQGACQAIEDAYVLSECLKKYEALQAFTEYHKIRYDKARWIVEKSRKIGKISQLNHHSGIWLRNLILGLIPTSLAHRETKKILDLNY